MRGGYKTSLITPLFIEMFVPIHMYLCVMGVNFVSFCDFLYLILELFRQCGNFFFILILIHKVLIL